jgi:hypothetical protein
MGVTRTLSTYSVDPVSILFDIGKEATAVNLKMNK